MLRQKWFKQYGRFRNGRMTLPNTRYGILYASFHWLMAFGLLVMISIVNNPEYETVLGLLFVLRMFIFTMFIVEVDSKRIRKIKRVPTRSLSSFMKYVWKIKIALALMLLLILHFGYTVRFVMNELNSQKRIQSIEESVDLLRLDVQ